MIEPHNSKYLEPSKQYRRFSLLLSIKKAPHSTQKELGLGNSLSSAMVNNYIKELTREKLIKVTGRSNRSMAYYLTPSGESYLAENFLNFSAEIVQFYAGVRREIAEILTECYTEGVRTLVLYGASDTAEIVYSAVKKTELTVTGVVDGDPGKIGTFFWDFQIQPPTRINKIKPDALLITSFARQNEILESIRKTIDSNIQIRVISRV